MGIRPDYGTHFHRMEGGEMKNNTPPNWKQIHADRDKAAALPEREWTRLTSQRDRLYQLLNRKPTK